MLSVVAQAGSAEALPAPAAHAGHRVSAAEAVDSEEGEAVVAVVVSGVVVAVGPVAAGDAGKFFDWSRRPVRA